MRPYWRIWRVAKRIKLLLKRVYFYFMPNKPKRTFKPRGFRISCIRETIEQARMGTIRGASLNDQLLNNKQRAMLMNAGWRKHKLADHHIWLSPKKMTN